MQSNASNVLPFVRVADVQVARPFPLKFRIDRTIATSYFESEDARAAKASELIHAGRAVVFLPSKS